MRSSLRVQLRDWLHLQRRTRSVARVHRTAPSSTRLRCRASASHSAVSRTVSRERPRRKSGRLRANALPRAVEACVSGSDAGIHSGSPIHGLDVEVEQHLVRHPDALRAATAAACVQLATRSPNVHCRDGDVALKVPATSRSSRSSMKRREIARVDELQRALRWRGNDRLRPAIAEQRRMHEARGPIAEAIGRIVRAHDQPRAHVRRARAEHARHRGFARGLERAVVLGNVLAVGVFERAPAARPRRARVGRASRTPRSRRRRDSARRAAPAASADASHDARHVAGQVDDRVPRPVAQRVEPRRDARIAVAGQRLHGALRGLGQALGDRA